MVILKKGYDGITKKKKTLKFKRVKRFEKLREQYMISVLSKYAKSHTCYGSKGY